MDRHYVSLMKFPLEALDEIPPNTHIQTFAHAHAGAEPPRDMTADDEVGGGHAPGSGGELDAQTAAAGRAAVRRWLRVQPRVAKRAAAVMEAACAENGLPPSSWLAVHVRQYRRCASNPAHWSAADGVLLCCFGSLRGQRSSPGGGRTDRLRLADSEPWHVPTPSLVCQVLEAAARLRCTGCFIASDDHALKATLLAEVRRRTSSRRALLERQPMRLDGGPPRP